MAKHTDLRDFGQLQRRSGSWQPPPRPTSSRGAQEAPTKSGAVIKHGLKREPSLESKKGSEDEPADTTRSASQQSTSRSLAKPTGKNVPSKREKSDLFKSFAKAKPRLAKQEPNAPAASEEESVCGAYYLSTLHRLRG